jgi:hypothetical protein
MPTFKPTVVGFNTLAIKILMLLLELYPELVLVNFIVKLAGIGGFAKLFPK